MSQDAWNPSQYEKFHKERLRPFFDLVELIEPRPGMRVIDLGCGTGEITEMLQARLPDSLILGIDNSEAMLERARPRASERLRFQQEDIARCEHFEEYDLVFSHAALQWVPDNEGLLAKILGQMRPGAQIAVQVPSNDQHASHRLAAELAGESPFRELLGGFVRKSAILSLERYSEILYKHGFTEQVAIEKIYGHLLASTGEVVEWVKGTLLTSYAARLGEEDFAEFTRVYRERLLKRLGDKRPYFYPFRRTLFWGKKS